MASKFILGNISPAKVGCMRYMEFKVCGDSVVFDAHSQKVADSVFYQLDAAKLKRKPKR
jgi:hypothetical protein